MPAVWRKFKPTPETGRPYATRYLSAAGGIYRAALSESGLLKKSGCCPRKCLTKGIGISCYACTELVGKLNMCRSRLPNTGRVRRAYGTEGFLISVIFGRRSKFFDGTAGR